MAEKRKRGRPRKNTAATPRKTRTKKSTKNFRSDLQIAEDRALIITLYIEGKTQVEIAKRVTSDLKRKYTLTQQQVSFDIKESKALIKASFTEKITDALLNELTKLDYMESELWDAWHRSKKPQRITKVKEETEVLRSRNGEIVMNGDAPLEGVTGSTTEVTEKEQLPDASYMAQINNVIEKRCKILALYAPTKIVIDDAKGVDDMDLDELEQELIEAEKKQKALLN